MHFSLYNYEKVHTFLLAIASRDTGPYEAMYFGVNFYFNVEITKVLRASYMR